MYKCFAYHKGASVTTFALIGLMMYFMIGSSNIFTLPSQRGIFVGSTQVEEELDTSQSYPPAKSKFEKFRETYINWPVVTEKLEHSQVIYNRVTKCGSSTMIWICRKLAQQNYFPFYSESYPGIEMSLSEPEKVEFAKKVTGYGDGTLFIRHFHFFNFAEYGQPAPIFINVVREPVDRFISRFYYRRFGFNHPKNTAYHKKRMQRIAPERINMTIEECVYGGVEDCIIQEKYKPVLTFFCDGDPSDCRKLTDYSLNLAMKNAAEYYTSIGLTEDFNNTLKVFEAVLPRYFNGADKLLPLCPETSRTKSKHRTEPSDDLKAILRKALRIDIKFYEFVKKRFYRQLDELKKLGRIKKDS